jgi:ssDNA-binding replication factor A large subunit
MINLPLDESISRISKKTGLSQDEVKDKIKAKLRALAGLISEEGAAHIVANELNVKLFETGEALKIKNIMPGMRNVDVTGKVIQKYELREYNSEKGPGKVASMLLGDDSGIIRITMWHKQAELITQIKEGDVIKINGGYVRENNGRKEIHLNEMSKLNINPKGVEVELKPYTPQTFTRKKISEVTEEDSAIELLGTVVQVFDMTFFEVCPQCNKRVRMREEGFMCPTHGKIIPGYNYVMNIYLDDGSDNIRVVLWREQAEQLLDLPREKMLSFREDSAAFEGLKNDLLGNIIKVSGKAVKNQNFDRIEIVASKIDKNPNPKEEIERIKKEPAVEKKDSYMQTPAPQKQSGSFKPEPKKNSSEDEIENINIEDELMDIDDI